VLLRIVGSLGAIWVYWSITTCECYGIAGNGEIDRVGNCSPIADRRPENPFLYCNGTSRLSLGRIQLPLARLFEYQDLGDEDSSVTTSTSRMIICRESPRRFPVVTENSPVHLHSPALIPLPLVLDESQVLLGSLCLPFGQTGEMVSVQLSHRSHRKLSF